MGIDLVTVGQSVVVAVWIARIGSVCNLIRVTDTIIIGISLGGVGPGIVFLQVGEPVSIQVAGSELAQVPGEVLLLVAVGNAVAVGVDIGIEAVEVGPPALAVAVGVKDRGSPRC